MTQQVNLYQPIFRKEQKKFSARAMLESIALMIVGVALMFGFTVWQIHSLRGEAERAEQQRLLLSKRVAEATLQLTAKGGARSLDAEIAALERELGARQRLQGLMEAGVLGNSRGFSDYFVAFARQQVPGVWLTGLDIAGAAERMTLQGRSSDPELVPRYVQKLSAEKRLSGIEFQVFQMSRPVQVQGAQRIAAPYVEFVLKTTGEAPAATP